MVFRLLGLFVGAALCLAPMAASAQSLSLSQWASYGMEADQISFHQDGTMIVSGSSGSTRSILSIKDNVVSMLMDNEGRYSVVGPDDHLYVDLNMVDVARYAQGSSTPTHDKYFEEVGAASSFAIALSASGAAYSLELSTASILLKQLTLQSKNHTVLISGQFVGSYVTDLKVAPDGKIWISTTNGDLIRYDVSRQEAETIPITGNAQGMAFDPNGNLYLADKTGNRILKLAPGQTTPEVIITGVKAPTALTFFNNALYVAHQGEDNLYHISTTGSLAPAPVPTLSEWAMILLALGLGAGAVVHLQGRRGIKA